MIRGFRTGSSGGRKKWKKRSDRAESKSPREVVEQTVAEFFVGKEPEPRAIALGEEVERRQTQGPSIAEALGVTTDSGIGNPGLEDSTGALRVVGGSGKGLAQNRVATSSVGRAVVELSQNICPLQRVCRQTHTLKEETKLQQRLNDAGDNGKRLGKMLGNHRDDLLAFARQLDADLAVLAQQFEVEPALLRELLLHQTGNPNHPGDCQREARFQQRADGRLHGLQQAVCELARQTVRASSMIENRPGAGTELLLPAPPSGGRTTRNCSSFTSTTVAFQAATGPNASAKAPANS